MSLELKAKEMLESGDIKTFEEFIIENSEKINFDHRFDTRIGFPIILLQTYRKAESGGLNKSKKAMVKDYKHCLRFLVEMGCDLNVQDEMGKTFAHWTILLHCLDMLAIALELGCDTLLQDSEGETIVHLAIRYNDETALETIKLYANSSEVFEAPSETSGATPLIYAVQIGAVDIVRKLLQLSVNVDGQENNQYKRTALHYALFTDNEEIFTILLKNKARPDIKDYKSKSVIDRVVEHPKSNFLKVLTHFSGSEIFSNSPRNANQLEECSPITLACKNGDYSKLCDLIEKEKDHIENLNLLFKDNEQRTALHHCVDNPDTKCAEKLIELEPNLIGKKDKNGFTVLHLATIANNKKLVELLIKNGCDIKESDNDGHTSLHWAVVCCATELIETLLKADPEIRHRIDNHGATPLHYATQSFLSPEGSVQGPIVIEKLLKNNKDGINCSDYDNRTPLLWAASLGITDCCQILLEGGADINHMDSNGLSALHCAASRGHYDVADLLVNKWSMPVDIVDNNLCTPLFYAVTLKQMPIIHFLAEQRSNPNHQDIKGRSVAHCAALKGYCDILDLIKNIGGSLTLKNNNGDLPLHEAAETGKSEVCQLLLQKMKENNEINLINAINNCGFSPLHEAAQNNYNDICKRLISYGADINLLTQSNSRPKGGVDKSNLCPLDLATDSKTKGLLKDLKGMTSKDLWKKIETEKNNNSECTPSQIESIPICHTIPMETNDLQTGEKKGYSSVNNELQMPTSIHNVDNSSKKSMIGSDKIEQSPKVVKMNKFNKTINSKNDTNKGSLTSSSRNKSLESKRINEDSVITKSSEKNVEQENLKISKDSKINKNFREIEKSVKYSKHRTPVSKTYNDDDDIKTNGPVSNESSTQEKLNEMRKVNFGKQVPKTDDSTYSEAKTGYPPMQTSIKTELPNTNEKGKNITAAKECHSNTVKSFDNKKHEEKSKIEIETKKMIMKNTSKGVTRMPEKLINEATSEASIVISDKSHRPKGVPETKIKTNSKSSKEKTDDEEIDNERQNTVTLNSNQTANNHTYNYSWNYRKPGKSKPFDLFSKVVKSVKEYESVRDRMRSLSDQKRMGIFQGYNKSIKLDRIPTKNNVKPKKNLEQNPDYIELPELTMFDPSTLHNPELAKKRALFPTPLSKEEQIRSVYESQSYINTLGLYSYLP